MSIVIAVAGTPELVGGRYRLVELIGQGGMGRVWRGHDETLDRPVAVKQILLHGGLIEEERDQLAQRLLREARAAARLNHSGIVTVHDIVLHAGAPVLVMEFLAGPSLAAVIKQEGRLPYNRVAELGAAMLDALRTAHAAGVVHRDLKPDNVLLAGRRTVITDFGIANMAGATRMTASGTLLGTPGYMAPEQIEGQPATELWDLWSLGVTLYNAVEGVAPFDGPTLTAVFAAILTKDPRPPQHAGPLAEVLAGLLVKDPAARATAEQTADALEAISRPAPRSVPRPVQTPAPHVSRSAPPPSSDRTDTAATAKAPSDLDGGTMVAAGPGEGAWSRKPAADRITRLLEGHADTVRAVAFSPDGTLLATAAHDQTARLWDLATGRTIREITGYSGSVGAVAFSPDGRTVATAHGGQWTRLWDVGTGQETYTLTSKVTGVHSVAFSPDGMILATGGSSARFWDTTTGKATTLLKEDPGSANSIAFSPHGTLLATNTRLWDLSTGRLFKRLQEQPTAVSSVAFSPDGSFFAAGTSRSVQVWHIESGRTIVLKGHVPFPTSVAFSADGKTLAAGGGDRTVRLWDVSTGRPIREITSHTDDVHTVAFSPDGTLLASAGKDKAVRLTPVA